MKHIIAVLLENEPGALSRVVALFSARGARYDARKFVWIGSMNSEVGVSVAWHTAPVKKAQDLFTTELIVAGAANTDQSVLFPNALNKLLGTKFRIIAGYGGSSETALALERGEAQGIGGWNYSSIQTNRPQWLRDATINILVQLSLARHPDLPNVPTVLEIARNDEERAAIRKRAQDFADKGLEPFLPGALERWLTPAFRQAHPEAEAEIAAGLRANNLTGYLRSYRIFAFSDDTLAPKAGGIR